MNIDELLKDLKLGNIYTNIPSADFYDNFVKDNPYYQSREEFYCEGEYKNEENYNKMIEEQDEIQKFNEELFEYYDELSCLEHEVIEEKEHSSKKNKEINRYIKALEYRYYNRKESSESEYIYMYEIYVVLKAFSCMAIKQNLKSEYIDDLIEQINNNIDIAERLENIYSYNINVEVLNSMIDHLEKIKFYVDSNNFDDATIINDEFIEEYFESKENQYRSERAKTFTKRKNRQEEYEKWLYSYEYINGEITKNDIAKIMGVSKAAVTQYCKRHGIK